MSRPTRARGLKPYNTISHSCETDVAPHAGAWIETETGVTVIHQDRRRAPRGRVD